MKPVEVFYHGQNSVDVPLLESTIAQKETEQIVKKGFDWEKRGDNLSLTYFDVERLIVLILGNEKLSSTFLPLRSNWELRQQI